VKQGNDLLGFFSIISQAGIVVSEQQKDQIQRYFSLLQKFSVNHRLISLGDKGFVVEKHFTSSFLYVQHLFPVIAKGDTVLDLGSGGGLPGVFLSIFFPENKIVLIDSIRKKTLFLKRVIKELSLNCTVVNDRIENYLSNNNEKFKIITARALASIDVLIQMTQTSRALYLYTLKGDYYLDEIETPENVEKVQSVKVSNLWKGYSSYLENKTMLKITIQ